VDLRGTDYFPWLVVTTDEEYPRLFITRNPDRSRKTPRFGPYPDAGNLRRLTAFLMEIHPLRRCGASRLAPRKRPCLMGQMNRCPAPCTGRDPEGYRAAVAGVLGILGGGWDDARSSMERCCSQPARRRYEERPVTGTFEKALYLRWLPGRPRRHCLPGRTGGKDNWG
jgi:excinuclease ABC subunit C